MKIGFIGLGNMASAIIGGVIKKGVFAPADVVGVDIFPAAGEKARASFGIEVAASDEDVVKAADMIVLAVKPQFYAGTISQIRDAVDDSKLIVTIAPGKTLAWLTEQFGKEVKLVRCMPNTPAMVLAGCTAVCPSRNVSREELDCVMKVVESFGRASIVPENLMDVVVGISGSSPAYVFMFIEALADAAVEEGMPRAQAYEFAAQAVYGSAKMMLELKKHPGELKDMVCSPAGTTIEAVKILEEKGFRASVLDATVACIEKSKSL